MTVLSCLWLFKNLSPYRNIFDCFWPNTQNYYPLVTNLGITPEIARKSFVTDFARVANRSGKRDAKKSKEILLEEIRILEPELIVLVGAEPRNAFYNELLDTPEKYMYVPFSIKGVPKKTQEEGPALYRELRNRLGSDLSI
nr:uracil-DNA glycosylase family protein [Neobacillus sp. Marseille-Q6967]